MAKVTLYGTANSRANRVIWTLNELGLDYDHKPIDFRKGETNTPEYLAMNPLPTLPTLKDGDIVVHESCAINLYLAKKYPGGQMSKLSEQEEIEATQWSFWSMWNIERHTTEILNHTAELGTANAPVSSFGEDAEGELFICDTNGRVRKIGPQSATPGCRQCGTQDYNGDGDFGTDQDIEAFFACLAGSCCSTCCACGQDFNADGDFGTDQDIESFFRVLAGGAC